MQEKKLEKNGSRFGTGILGCRALRRRRKTLSSDDAYELRLRGGTTKMTMDIKGPGSLSVAVRDPEPIKVTLNRC
jgi:hypothetical protein